METKAEKTAPETVTVTVDGRETQFPKGQNLLKALLDSGIHIPHYCWHPSLSVAGNCRLCMVEIEGQPRPAVSCNMACTDGLKIRTDSELVLDARKGMMEFLLQNHPLDCPICDRGGECMLQRYSMQHGTGTARTVDQRRRFEKPQFDPLIDIERNRCIMCTRCVRFMDEEAGDHVLGVFGRGDRNYIGTEGNGPVSSIFSGNIIDLCPVGCLTSKPFRFKARPWELQQVNSTCTLCSAGCETTAWIRDGQVYA
jgi:NADH-quinone oxidoreductase subunit G